MKARDFTAIFIEMASKKMRADRRNLVFIRLSR
jgi:hypothetical protein